MSKRVHVASLVTAWASLLACVAIPTVANACEPSSVLIDSKVIIVDGRAKIIKEKESQDGSTTEYEGTAEIAAATVRTNFTRMRAPFKFYYHAYDDYSQGCFYGHHPLHNGFLTRFYLRASDKWPHRLELISLEVLDQD